MSSENLVLKDAMYVIADASTIKKDHSILIEGNRIVAIAPYKEIKANYTVDAERDCSGQAILPGLARPRAQLNWAGPVSCAGSERLPHNSMAPRFARAPDSQKNMLG